MPEHISERARFTELRARAMTQVILSSRQDFIVKEMNEADYGIDYLVTVRTDKPGLRQFAVALRAAHSPVTAETANKLLKPTMQGVARYGPFPYPVVLFYFTMMESQSWYTWLMKPVGQKDGKMALEPQEQADCQPLDPAVLDVIVAYVDQWYDFFFHGESGRKSGRPVQAAKTSGKLVKAEVVITEVESILFDYSEALLQTREQFTAAKQCSSYILKSYPTQLHALKGFWDREEDGKGRAVISLKVMDTVTKRSGIARFTPKDIQHPAHVYQRFSEMVGELLNPR